MLFDCTPIVPSLMLLWVSQIICQISIALPFTRKPIGEEGAPTCNKNRIDYPSDYLKDSEIRWVEANDARETILLWLIRMSRRELNPYDFGIKGFNMLVIARYC